MKTRNNEPKQDKLIQMTCAPNKVSEQRVETRQTHPNDLCAQWRLRTTSRNKNNSSKWHVRPMKTQNNEPKQDKLIQMTCAPNEDSEQQAKTRQTHPNDLCAQWRLRTTSQNKTNSSKWPVCPMKTQNSKPKQDKLIQMTCVPNEDSEQRAKTRQTHPNDLCAQWRHRTTSRNKTNSSKWPVCPMKTQNNEPKQDKLIQMTCAPHEDSEQRAKTRKTHPNDLCTQWIHWVHRSFGWVFLVLVCCSESSWGAQVIWMSLSCLAQNNWVFIGQEQLISMSLTCCGPMKTQSSTSRNKTNWIQFDLFRPNVMRLHWRHKSFGWVCLVSACCSENFTGSTGQLDEFVLFRLIVTESSLDAQETFGWVCLVLACCSESSLGHRSFGWVCLVSNSLFWVFIVCTGHFGWVCLVSAHCSESSLGTQVIWMSLSCFGSLFWVFIGRTCHLDESVLFRLVVLNLLCHRSFDETGQNKKLIHCAPNGLVVSALSLHGTHRSFGWVCLVWLVVPSLHWAHRSFGWVCLVSARCSESSLGTQVNWMSLYCFSSLFWVFIGHKGHLVSYEDSAHCSESSLGTQVIWMSLSWSFRTVLFWVFTGTQVIWMSLSCFGWLLLSLHWPHRSFGWVCLVSARCSEDFIGCTGHLDELVVLSLWEHRSFGWPVCSCFGSLFWVFIGCTGHLDEFVLFRLIVLSLHWAHRSFGWVCLCLLLSSLCHNHLDEFDSEQCSESSLGAHVIWMSLSCFGSLFWIFIGHTGHLDEFVLFAHCSVFIAHRSFDEFFSEQQAHCSETSLGAQVIWMSLSMFRLIVQWVFIGRTGHLDEFVLFRLVVHESSLGTQAIWKKFSCFGSLFWVFMGRKWVFIVCTGLCTQWSLSVSAHCSESSLGTQVIWMTCAPHCTTSFSSIVLSLHWDTGHLDEFVLFQARCSESSLGAQVIWMSLSCFGSLFWVFIGHTDHLDEFVLFRLTVLSLHWAHNIWMSFSCFGLLFKVFIGCTNSWWLSCFGSLFWVFIGHTGHLDEFVLFRLVVLSLHWVHTSHLDEFVLFWLVVLSLHGAHRSFGWVCLVGPMKSSEQVIWMIVLSLHCAHRSFGWVCLVSAHCSESSLGAQVIWMSLSCFGSLFWVFIGHTDHLDEFVLFRLTVLSLHWAHRSFGWVCLVSAQCSESSLGTQVIWMSLSCFGSLFWVFIGHTGHLDEFVLFRLVVLSLHWVHRSFGWVFLVLARCSESSWGAQVIWMSLSMFRLIVLSLHWSAQVIWMSLSCFGSLFWVFIGHTGHLDEIVLFWLVVLSLHGATQVIWMSLSCFSSLFWVFIGCTGHLDEFFLFWLVVLSLHWAAQVIWMSLSCFSSLFWVFIGCTQVIWMSFSCFGSLFWVFIGRTGHFDEFVLFRLVVLSLHSEHMSHLDDKTWGASHLDESCFGSLFNEVSLGAQVIWMSLSNKTHKSFGWVCLVSARCCESSLGAQVIWMSLSCFGSLFWVFIGSTGHLDEFVLFRLTVPSLHWAHRLIWMSLSCFGLLFWVFIGRHRSFGWVCLVSAQCSESSLGTQIIWMRMSCFGSMFWVFIGRTGNLDEFVLFRLVVLRLHWAHRSFGWVCLVSARCSESSWDTQVIWMSLSCFGSLFWVFIGCTGHLDEFVLFSGSLFWVFIGHTGHLDEFVLFRLVVLSLHWAHRSFGWVCLVSAQCSESSLGANRSFGWVCLVSARCSESSLGTTGHLDEFVLFRLVVLSLHWVHRSFGWVFLVSARCSESSLGTQVIWIQFVLFRLVVLSLHWLRTTSRNKTNSSKMTCAHNEDSEQRVETRQTHPNDLCAQWRLRTTSQNKTNSSKLPVRPMKTQDNEPKQDKLIQMNCGPNEDSEPPGHLPNLISLQCALYGKLRAQTFFR